MSSLGKKLETTRYFASENYSRAALFPYFVQSTSKSLRNTTKNLQNSASQDAQHWRRTFATKIFPEIKSYILTSTEKTFIFWEEGCTDTQPSELKTFPVYSQLLYSRILYPLLLTLPQLAFFVSTPLPSKDIGKPSTKTSIKFWGAQKTLVAISNILKQVRIKSPSKLWKGCLGSSFQ